MRKGKTNIKKFLTALLAGVILLCGCAGTKPEKVELTVFAAASLTETMTEIAELYHVGHPNVTIEFNFDSSGTLKTQIEEGAVCDLFLSAGQKQMNELDAILEESRTDLLENQVVLCVPEGNPANVDGFDDLAARLADGSVFLAMGNADVSVGQYTRKILTYYELDEETLAAAGVLTYGTNVKEVTTQIAEGAVDCGVIYSTDAFSAELTIVDTATADMCGQVIYPAAVIESSIHPKEAQEFLDFLRTDDAVAVFEAVGFRVLT